MANFPKMHGIRLAANGFIENARFEQLATDPTPVSAGRVWYNTTEKAMKLSSLDSEGAVVIQTFSTAEELAVLEALVNTINGDSSTEGSFRKTIADVVGAAPEALNTLQEIAAAMNNDPNLYDTLVNLVNTSISDLNSEILGTATAAMDTLGEVEAAITALQGQVSGSTGDLATLTTDAKADLVGAINEVDLHADQAKSAADSAQAELDVTQAGAGLNTDGTYKGRTGSNYLDAATSLADEGTKLDSALKAADDRAKAAEGDLTALTTDAKTSLVEAINELQSEAGAGAEALKTELNGRVFPFASTVPALIHTVTHNFGTNRIQIGDVFVKHSDGVWRNDIVNIERAADNNSFTVNLVEAGDIEVMVENLSPLA